MLVDVAVHATAHPKPDTGPTIFENVQGLPLLSPAGSVLPRLPTCSTFGPLTHTCQRPRSLADPFTMQPIALNARKNHGRGARACCRTDIGVRAAAEQSLSSRNLLRMTGNHPLRSYGPNGLAKHTGQFARLQTSTRAFNFGQQTHQG